MAKQGEQKKIREYKIYIRSTKDWSIVTEEVYRTYYREAWATRSRARAHGQCRCPKEKAWVCDGDCLICEYRQAGDTLSLDCTIKDGEGKEKSWLNDLQDDAPDAQSILEGKALLGALHRQLQELDPEERRICELIMQGKSERKAAASMNMTRSTFKRYWDKLRQTLNDNLKEYR